MFIRLVQLSLLGLLVSTFLACDKNQNINIFSVEDDKELGRQVSQEIETSGDYNVVDPSAAPEAYSYLRSLRDKVINSGEVVYQDEFVWEVHLIKDDATLNAFCTPGGYIYFYTGLIKYLNIEDHMVGVLGHEVAHADLRHTSRQLQVQYGIDVLLSVVLGEDQGTLAQIAAGLATLSYSRKYESEADARSVEYLGATEYNCAGAAGFFQRLEEQGQSSNVPVFLSTHPAPENRIKEINAKADNVGCTTANADPTTYQQFINNLP